MRVMPNVACLVRQAASAIAPGSDATAQDTSLVDRLMASVGICTHVKVGQVVDGSDPHQHLTDDS